MLKKENNNFFLVYVCPKFEEESEDFYAPEENRKIIKGLEIHYIPLTFNQKTMKRKIRNVSFEEIQAECFEPENYYFDIENFTLKGFFTLYQKLLLSKKLRNMLGEKPIKSEKSPIELKFDVKEFSSKNMDLFTLPCFGNIINFFKKPLEIKKTIYSNSKCYLGRIYWRFSFLQINDEKLVNISMYFPLLQIVNYLIIKDTNLQVKLLFIFFYISSFFNFYLIIQIFIIIIIGQINSYNS